MRPQEDLTHLLQRAFHRGELRENRHAISIFLNHPTHTPELPFHATNSVNQLLLFVALNHEELVPWSVRIDKQRRQAFRLSQMTHDFICDANSTAAKLPPHPHGILTNHPSSALIQPKTSRLRTPASRYGKPLPTGRTPADRADRYGFELRLRCHCDKCPLYFGIYCENP